MSRCRANKLKLDIDHDEKHFWADEVRLSLAADTPKVLFASTRGLESHTKGYLAAFALAEDGLFVSAQEALHIWQTPTVGSAFIPTRV